MKEPHAWEWLVSKKTCMMCYWSDLVGEVLHENLYFDPLASGWSWISLMRGFFMCTCTTKSGPWGASTIGEEHQRMWHMLNTHYVYCWGKNWRLKRFIRTCCERKSVFIRPPTVGLGRLCSDIRLLCNAPLLPTTSYCAPGWILICSINMLICL